MVSQIVKHVISSSSAQGGRVCASRTMGIPGGRIMPSCVHYQLRYTYTIDPTNGSPTTTASTLFPYGTYSALLEVPEWAHHHFCGWYQTPAQPTSSPPGGQPISPLSRVDYSVRAVYARWQLPVTIAFDATSGGGEMPGGWVSPDYYAGVPFGTLPIPTNPTEPFAGWFCNGDPVTEYSLVPDGGCELVARYGYPYDSRVEYIQSSGTQYINTEIVPDQTTVVQFKVYNLQATGYAILGYMEGGDSTDWRFFNAGGTMYCDVWNKRCNGSRLNINTWRELEMGNCYVTDLATGNRLISTSAAAAFTGLHGLCLNGDTSFSHNRWAYVKIYKGGNLVLDAYAVRVGSEGRMYDEIAGRLLPVYGGSFSCGPDISGGAS